MTQATLNPAASFVLLQVGNLRFGLPADSVIELAPPVRLHSFPHTSSLLSGVIVRRGRIVPVYDVSPVLGLRSSIHRFYLIAQRSFGAFTEACAIPVNGECELASGDLLPAGEDRPGYVAGVLNVEGLPVEILDFEALVNQPAAPENSLPGEDQP